MNALELIKRGIIDGDMAKISKGYAMMTGEKLEPSQITDEHVQKLKDVFSDLQGRHTHPEKTDSGQPSPSPSPFIDSLTSPVLGETFTPNINDYENNFSLPEDEPEEQLASEELLDEGASPADSVEEIPLPPQNKLFIPGVNEAKPKFTLSTNFNEQPLDGSEAPKGGGNMCSRVQFPIKKRINKFVDNKAYASEDTLLFDKKVRSHNSINAHKMIEKRPADVGVVVTCRDCNRRYKISSKMAPGRIAGDDVNTYQCDGCILRKRGR